MTDPAWLKRWLGLSWLMGGSVALGLVLCAIAYARHHTWLPILIAWANLGETCAEEARQAAAGAKAALTADNAAMALWYVQEAAQALGNAEELIDQLRSALMPE